MNNDGPIKVSSAAHVLKHSTSDSAWQRLSQTHPSRHRFVLRRGSAPAKPSLYFSHFFKPDRQSELATSFCLQLANLARDALVKFRGHILLQLRCPSRQGLLWQWSHQQTQQCLPRL
eukprot:scaffold56625_cov18-Tisochrysis_lutea.AAC.1